MLVAGMNAKAVNRGVSREDPLHPIRVFAVRSAKHIVSAFIPLPQLSAEQNASTESQFYEMAIHDGEIVIVQFLRNHRKKPAEALRFKSTCVFVGNSPQFLELFNEHLQHYYRAA